MGKTIITARSVPQSLCHAPHAVQAGPFVFVSGLYATDFKTGIAVKPNPDFPFIRKDRRRDSD